MKKSLGEIMSDPRIWEMSGEEKQRGRERIMEIAKRERDNTIPKELENKQVR